MPPVRPGLSKPESKPKPPISISDFYGGTLKPPAPTSQAPTQGATNKKLESAAKAGLVPSEQFESSLQAQPAELIDIIKSTPKGLFNYFGSFVGLGLGQPSKFAEEKGIGWAQNIPVLGFVLSKAAAEQATSFKETAKDLWYGVVKNDSFGKYDKATGKWIYNPDGKTDRITKALEEGRPIGGLLIENFGNVSLVGSLFTRGFKTAADLSEARAASAGKRAESAASTPEAMAFDEMQRDYKEQADKWRARQTTARTFTRATERVGAAPIYAYTLPFKASKWAAKNSGRYLAEYMRARADELDAAGNTPAASQNRLYADRLSRMFGAPVKDPDGNIVYETGADGKPRPVYVERSATNDWARERVRKIEARISKLKREGINIFTKPHAYDQINPETGDVWGPLTPDEEAAGFAIRNGRSKLLIAIQERLPEIPLQDVVRMGSRSNDIGYNLTEDGAKLAVAYEQGKLDPVRSARLAQFVAQLEQYVEQYLGMPARKGEGTVRWNPAKQEYKRDPLDPYQDMPVPDFEKLRAALRAHVDGQTLADMMDTFVENGILMLEPTNPERVWRIASIVDEAPDDVLADLSIWPAKERNRIAEILAIREELGQRGATNVVGRPFPPDGVGGAPEPLAEDPVTGLPTVEDILAQRLPGELPRSSMAYMRRSLQKLSKLRGRAARLMQERIDAELAADTMERNIIKMRLRIQEMDGFWLNRLGRQVFPNKKGELPKSARRIPGLLEDARRARDEQLAVYEQMVREQTDSTVVDGVVVNKETIAENVETLDKAVKDLEATREGIVQAIGAITDTMTSIDDIKSRLIAELDEEGIDIAGVMAAIDQDVADIPETGIIDLDLPEDMQFLIPYVAKATDLAQSIAGIERMADEGFGQIQAEMAQLARDAQAAGVLPEELQAIQEQMAKIEDLLEQFDDEMRYSDVSFYDSLEQASAAIADLSIEQLKILQKALDRKIKFVLNASNFLRHEFTDTYNQRQIERPARKKAGDLVDEQAVRDFDGDRTAFEVSLDPVLMGTIIRHQGLTYEIKSAGLSNQSYEIVRLNPIDSVADPYAAFTSIAIGPGNSLTKVFQPGKNGRLAIRSGGHIGSALKPGWPQKQIFAAIAKDVQELLKSGAARKGKQGTLDAQAAKARAELDEIVKVFETENKVRDSLSKAANQAQVVQIVLGEIVTQVRSRLRELGAPRPAPPTYGGPQRKPLTVDQIGQQDLPFTVDALEGQIANIDDLIAIYDRTGIFYGDAGGPFDEISETVASNPALEGSPVFNPGRALELRELALDIREQLVARAETAIIEAPAETVQQIADAVKDGVQAAAKPDPFNKKQYKAVQNGALQFDTGTRTYRITTQERAVKPGAKTTRRAYDYVVQRVATDGQVIESTTMVFKSVKAYQKYIAESIGIDEQMAARGDTPIDRPALMPPRGPVWSKDLIDAEARLAKLEGERISLLRGVRRGEAKLDRERIKAAKLRALGTRTDAASKRLEARLGREVITAPGLDQVGLQAAPFSPELGARLRPSPELIDQTRAVNEALPDAKVRAEAEQVAASLAESNLDRRSRLPVSVAMRAAMQNEPRFVGQLGGQDVYVYGSGYVPARSPSSGEPGPARVFTEGLTGFRKLSRQRYRTGEYSELYNMRELIRATVSEQRRMNQNEAIYALMNSSFALTAEELLGENALNQIADEAYNYVLNELQAYKAGRMDREAYFASRLREDIGRRIRTEMENRGWRTNAGEFTEITAPVPDRDISGQSRFLPRYVVEAVARKSSFTDPTATGAYLAAVRKGTSLFKNLTLPLSITWQLGDIISTFLLSAMTDVPINQLVKQMEIAYRENYGGGIREIFREETDRTVGPIGEFIGQSGLQDVGLRLEERAALEDVPSEVKVPFSHRIPYLGIIPRGYGKFRESAYRLNEFTNRLGRQAYFMAKLNNALEQYNRANGTNLTLDLIAQTRLDETNGEVHRLFWDTINQANDVMGDWMDLSAFERRYVMPHVTFYAWIKHINKLFFRVSMNDPAKIMWYMYLGQMAYDPDTDPYGMFGGSVSSFFGNSLARVDFAGPFTDVVSGPAGALLAPVLSGKPSESVADPLFQMVSPVPRLLAAAAGKSLRGGFSNLDRPPGQQMLNRQGRQISPQLISPSPQRVSELVGVTIDTFPLLRKIADIMPTGQIPGTDVQLGPYKTYETGYARTRPGTNILVEKPGGRLGSLLNLFNVPGRPSMTKQQAEEEQRAALLALTNAEKRQARLQALQEFQNG